MNESVKKEQAEKAIKSLCKTAAANILTTEEIEEGLTPQLEFTATAIQRNFGLDDSVMEEYHKEIEKAEDTDWADNIPYQDAEDARDLIYAMCDELDDPKEIMQHVRNASEMLYVWVNSN